MDPDLVWSDFTIRPSRAGGPVPAEAGAPSRYAAHWDEARHAGGAAVTGS